MFTCFVGRDRTEKCRDGSVSEDDKFYCVLEVETMIQLNGSDGTETTNVGDDNDEWEPADNDDLNALGEDIRQLNLVVDV